MKPQDIVFFFTLIFLVLLKKPKLFVYAGLASLILAIPLFAKLIFFTAERLTWYAAAFFLLAVIFSTMLPDKKSRS